MYKGEEKDRPGALERRSKMCLQEDGGGKEMPWEGEKGDRGMGGGLVGVLSPCVRVSLPLEEWTEQWKCRVPGLQMVWHCCHGYDWHSLYCTTRTVLHTTL